MTDEVERAVRAGMALEVMCAFCGETVEHGDLDPCVLIVDTRWERPEADRRSQQFFAHAECISGALHPEVRAEAFVLDIDDDCYRNNPRRRRWWRRA